MMPPIEISNLTKIYRAKKRKKILALQDVSLEVTSGEVFGFLGPNGAGKSTTIKTLMGLIRPTSGDVRLFGVPSVDPKARKRVGYLPENPAIYDFLSAREYLHLIGSSFSMNERQIRKESLKVLGLLDLEAAADRPIRGYSKGMVQRLGLAQTLLHDPDLYILDEPMSGLDPIGRALVKEIISELRTRGKTIFFSTHVTADVERVCDRIGVIIGGIFQKERTVREILREGVEGYFCRVRGGDVSFLETLGGKNCGENVYEVYIARHNFDAFVAEVIRNRGTLDFIEPHRRDLEDYFLSLVRNNERNV